jgi:hypothetical protein
LVTEAVRFRIGAAAWVAAWAPLELFRTTDVNLCWSSAPPWAWGTDGYWEVEPDNFSLKSVTPTLPFLCLTTLRFGRASLDRKSWELICPS